MSEENEKIDLEHEVGFNFEGILQKDNDVEKSENKNLEVVEQPKPKQKPKRVRRKSLKEDVSEAKILVDKNTSLDQVFAKNTLGELISKLDELNNNIVELILIQRQQLGVQTTTNDYFNNTPDVQREIISESSDEINFVEQNKENAFKPETVYIN